MECFYCHITFANIYRYFNNVAFHAFKSLLLKLALQIHCLHCRNKLAHKYFSLWSLPQLQQFFSFLLFLGRSSITDKIYEAISRNQAKLGRTKTSTKILLLGDLVLNSASIHFLNFSHIS